MWPPRRIWVSPCILLFFSLRVLANNLSSAGVDTTASVLGTFFLAMVCYPEVQKKAQAELDQVLHGRLPEHNDLASLPYFSALVKELHRYAAVYFNSFLQAKCVSTSFRWQPVTPLGCSSFFTTHASGSNKLTFFVVKASRISRPTTISTMAIIFRLILLWFPINGDIFGIELSSF